jgi:DNA-binding LacI/PurR family transcriptional regulator
MARERLAGLGARLKIAGGVCPDDVVVLIGLCGGHEPAFVDRLLAGETRPEILRRRFTAIACYNDWTAVHAIKYLTARGLRVPQDLSITGFDNVTPDWYDGPTLTTVTMPLEEIGADFGLTRERIRQLEAAALKKLRDRYRTREAMAEA